MSRMIFVNLPVGDLERGKTFVEALGAVNEPRFTDDTAACMTADSRESVDLTIERAVAAGGAADPSPKQDYGVMYGRSIADPDGHIWEIVWMDAAAAERGAPAIEEAIAKTADQH